MNKYQPAIVELQLALEIAENNAPIQEAEGNYAQAKVCRDRAESYRDAIALLEGATNAKADDPAQTNFDDDLNEPLGTPHCGLDEECTSCQ